MLTGLPKDPVMLLSVINTKLRDIYSDFDELCEAMDASKDEIQSILKNIDYEYDKELNQFV